MAKGDKSSAFRRYRRRGAIREPYEVVLVACEGEKTEPAYFTGLRAAFRLSSANVKVVPSEYGNDPVSVVRFGEDQLAGPDGYDRVYCVFDRNGHANFDEACQRVAESDYGREGRLIAVPSVPCFEFWILLHFEYTAAPYNAAGGRSSCMRVIDYLKRNHLSDYEKNFGGVFALLAPRYNDAVVHAERLERENSRSNSINPATQVHKLVKYLRDLRGRNA